MQKADMNQFFALLTDCLGSPTILGARTCTTLIRDQSGLGLRIHNDESSGNVYISHIAAGGAAERDGKIKVGDRIIQIGNDSVEGANKTDVISWLTRPERFVRLVLERENTSSSSLSPAVIDSSSYLANRPSYTGSYRRPALGSLSSLHSANEGTHLTPSNTSTATVTSQRSPQQQQAPVPTMRTFNGNTST